jgi:type IV pilus assembly protein PilW
MSLIDASYSRSRARGFTLVELMIALVIGLFIAGGLFTLVQAMKRTTTMQAGLSNLQDNERMAMSLIANVVQSAGFYPNPLLNSSSTFFLAAASPGTYTAGQTMTAGQSMSGVDVSGSSKLVSRYTSAGADTVLSCTGSTSATQVTWTATMRVDTANKNLVCDLYDGTVFTQTIPLVTGVESMQIVYGVKTQGGSLYNSADTYLTAAQVTAGGFWGAILSVRVTVNFTNPLKNQAGQSTVQGNAGATLPLTRVITVMNATGVDT